ncbi:baseplate J/gp47 family protein [Clostridium sp.]|uniref:baseplate assembly protein n=1 Tax=Clostridium sp. TaxID=1506 RepID=UPI002634344A|nr:baseplate J/gp47 family protein [Clostridium sp.]
MNLTNLPDVTFAQKDVETILNDMITGYENAYYEQTGEQITLYPGDKIRIFLYTQALREFQLRELINVSGRQNLLKYASGDYLENLGAFWDVERSDASYATVTEQFNLSAPQNTIRTIPKGTRASTSSGLYFAVTEDIDVPVGSTSITAVLTCTTSGTAGNGFIAGQINILTDPLPWIASVTNIDKSQGGADKEDDDDLRDEIRQAPEAYSVAGPSGAYEYFAKKYNQSIIDVKVSTPSPGIVDIRVLLTDGEIPTDTFLQGLKNYLSDKTKRPLTDNVQTNAPEVINYDINLVYYISNDDSTSASTIQTNVNIAIQEYKLWQKSRIGRDINIDELKIRIKNAGAKRSVVTNPVYTALTETQIAIASSNISVTYGGLEDD